MKNVILAILLASPLFINACKDKNEATPVENPISVFLKDTASVKLIARTSGPWELGLGFSASKAGKITQVGCRMPDPGRYRLLIWDFDSKALLRQKTVEQSTPGVLSLVNLDEHLPLVPDKKYLISISTQSEGVNKRYYSVHKAGVSNLFPFSKGNILVNSAVYSDVTSATFPNQTPALASEFYGVPEFSFIAD